MQDLATSKFVKRLPVVPHAAGEHPWVATIAIPNVTPTADYSVLRASLHNFTNGLLNGNEESKQRLKVHTNLPVLKLSHKSEVSAAVLSTTN